MRSLFIIMISLIFTSNYCQGVVIIEPIKLLCPARFDVMAKYIYAKHFDHGITQGWPLEVYREHLRVWNNFHEELPRPNFPHFNCAKEYIKKDSFTDFLTSFHLLLKSIKKEGFNNQKSVLPIDNNGILIDGSHRLTAALVYNIPVPIRIIPNFKNYNSQFFKNYERYVKNGLKEKYLDAMALEYATLKKNTFIAILFPSANYAARKQQIKNIFLQHGKIVYEKRAFLHKNGPLNLIALLYEGESWVGSLANRFTGAKGKAKACFPNNQGEICIFLYEAESIEQVKKVKKEIHNLFTVENHSIYINDTHQETIKIAQTLFLGNGIHWLNHAQKNSLPKFQRFLQKYIDWIKKNNINKELLCVDSSGVLAAYGLRDCSDLNFIPYYDEFSNFDIEINSHKDEMKYHKYTKENIILDPSYHFYIHGVKFASLEVVKAMKVNRNEVKDREDVKLINSL